MTRETKIGLLVGLAFLIIVGILLSEPLSHSGEVQPAPLPGIAQNVRNGVTTPGAASVVPPISQQPQNVGPQQPVPLEREVSRPHTGVVEIGPGGSHQPTQINTLAGNNSRPNAPTGTRPGNASGNTSGDTRTASGAGTDQNETPTQPHGPTAGTRGIDRNDPRIGAANDNGEELIPVGGQPGGGDGGAHPLAQRPVRNDAPRGSRSYAAVQGDSLSKIAAKFYGSGGKPMRDLIVNANPSLKQNADRIIAGQTYVIPPAPSADAGTEGTGPSTPAPQTQTPRIAATPTPEDWYTVKGNDNLWRIARDQLGDAGAVAALKELNKDVLHGSETVLVNMKLRLPAKPVATAS